MASSDLTGRHIEQTLVSSFMQFILCSLIFLRDERDFKSRVWDFNLGMVGDDDLSFNLWCFEKDACCFNVCIIDSC